MAFKLERVLGAGRDKTEGKREKKKRKKRNRGESADSVIIGLSST